MLQDSYSPSEEDYLMRFMRNRMHQQQSENQQDSDRNYVEDSFHQQDQLRSKLRQSEDYDEDNNQEDVQHSQFSQNRQLNHSQNHSINDSHPTQQQHQQNPCDDSFINLVDQHLTHLKKQAQSENKESLQQSNTKLQIISLSKQQVSHCLLQNQTVFDIVQLTNLMPVRSIAQIINVPFQFRLLNAKNKFIKRDQVQIILQPFESVEIQFEIKKRQNQIGNIYETLRVNALQGNQMKKSAVIQSKFLKFEITFVKPKLEVTFLGRTTVKRIQQHKIAHLQIYPNKMDEYSISLIFSQDEFSTMNSSRLQKIECQIETKGYISIHPNSVILYQNQPLKINLRRLTQSSGIGKTSAIIIRPLNSSLSYVIGVKCLQRTQRSVQEQDMPKLNKFML